MRAMTSDSVDEVCRQFSQDGLSFRVANLDEDAGRLDLKLEFSDVSCLDCVMPREHLQRLIAASIRKRFDRVVEVVVDDERTESAAAGPSASGQRSDGRAIVLDPTAPVGTADPDPGPPAGQLRGKTVLIRVDVLWRSWDLACEQWSAALRAAGANVLTWRRAQGVWGEEGRRVQGEYEGLVESADVLISGLGNCGSCTAWTIRDALTGLAHGISTVAVVTEQFLPLAKILAEDAHRPGLRICTLPYPLNNLPDDEIRDIARRFFPDALAVLDADT